MSKDRKFVFALPSPVVNPNEMNLSNQKSLQIPFSLQILPKVHCENISSNFSKLHNHVARIWLRHYLEIFNGRLWKQIFPINFIKSYILPLSLFHESWEHSFEIQSSIEVVCWQVQASQKDVLVKLKLLLAQVNHCLLKSNSFLTKVQFPSSLTIVISLNEAIIVISYL